MHHWFIPSVWMRIGKLSRRLKSGLLFSPFPGGSKIFLLTLGDINCCSDSAFLIEDFSRFCLPCPWPFPTQTLCPNQMIVCLQELTGLNLLNGQTKLWFSFYKDKQKQNPTKMECLICESSVLSQRRLCCGMWSAHLSKWSSTLSINKQNKTTAYCYLPTKLTKIYKWVIYSVLVMVWWY